jgi:sugar lactone lactonase YvrE
MTATIRSGAGRTAGPDRASTRESPAGAGRSSWLARCLAILPLVCLAAGGAAQVPPPPEGAPTTPALTRLLASGEVEVVADGFSYAEGPAWHRDGYLLFADSPVNRVLRWDPEKGTSIVREPSFGVSAMAFDRDGRLLATEHQNRRISRTEPDGTIVTVVDRYEGKRLNSPNDLVVGPDGTIFFTDPPYGLPRQREGKELEFQGVFRLDPNGRLRLLVRDMSRPNGIGLSPDARTLYVTDSARAHLKAFTFKPDGTVGTGRVLAKMPPWKSGVQGVPDGLVVNAAGHILVAGPGGVWVFAGNGGRLGVIATPEPPSAVTFGGPDGRTLFVTARTRVYRVQMTVGR